MKNKTQSDHPVFMPGDQWYSTDILDIQKIETILFVDTFLPGNGSSVICSWNASQNNDNRILVHLMEAGKKLIISGNGSGKIQANTSMKRMFAEFSALKTIEGLELIDTSRVIDMSYLFHHCTSLTHLNLSSWNVANVTSFRGTFCCGDNQIGNARLRSINLTGWDVSAATDMAYMFYGCGNLRRIDVSSWNTANVTNFRHTFADCFSLKKLDVSNWNTSSVITIDGIFNDCRSLKYIDISSWDTSNCEEFDQMFDNCWSIKKIVGIHALNTSSGFSFEEMFFGCRSLKRLDLSSLDTRRVDGHEFTAYHSSIKSFSNMRKMIVGCNRLRRLTIGNNLKWHCSEKNESTILQNLDALGYVVVSPKTGSMKPVLRPSKDHVLFKKKQSYKKNDIVLYWSNSECKLIGHRILRCLANGYLVQGDNARYSEYVPKDNVFAAASEIYRDKKIIKTNSLKFMLTSTLGIKINRLRYSYRKSDGYFWKTARVLRRTLIGRK